jgi:DNA adenine methylase
MAKKKIVNVASVPQRSPFRYPGGKTWLVPYLRAWLGSLPTRPGEFVEPFVGGGSISLTVAFENLADHVTMVELDDDVAAVWRVMLGDGAQWLASKITNFNMTRESVKDELSKPTKTLRENAFRTILRNRVLHGGILAPGSSLTKHGENGKGIASRWYAATLKRRILAIGEVKTGIDFIEGDGMVVMKDHAENPNAVFFLDPPYTAAGKKAGRRLYKHNELDHKELFRIATGLAGDFLITYDNAEGVLDMARAHGLDVELVAMKSTHHAEMTELLIGRNLSWARKSNVHPTQGLFS